MDEELRKAQRTLERAGIQGLLPEQAFILEKAFDLWKTAQGHSQGPSIAYYVGTFQTADFINYLNTHDRQLLLEKYGAIVDSIQYHIALVKFFYDEGKFQLTK